MKLTPQQITGLNMTYGGGMMVMQGGMFGGMMISGLAGLFYARDFAKGYAKGALGGAIVGGTAGLIAVCVANILQDVLQVCRSLQDRQYVAYSSSPVRKFLYRRYPQFTISPAQGIIFRLSTQSRIQLELVEPDDGPKQRRETVDRDRLATLVR